MTSRDSRDPLKKDSFAEIESITRRFNVILNEAAIEETFNLNNLTGSGRIDVVCRIINSTFFMSNAFRKNTELNLLFKKASQMLTIAGNTVRGINPDERAIAGVLKRVFSRKSYKGIEITDINWTETLALLEGYLMIENGSEIVFNNRPNPLPMIFTLGDQQGFDQDDLEIFLTNNNLQSCSLGNHSYLSSSCITIVHYLLDSQGKTFEEER
ncbi:MAG: hypothetical protein ACXAEU_03455 [Candidatus Hodarchaeales archaeon]|jgi:tRNA (pseudouridine54-N1)-methyltransferase